MVALQGIEFSAAPSRIAKPKLQSLGPHVGSVKFKPPLLCINSHLALLVAGNQLQELMTR